MFNKKKKIRESFETISYYIGELPLSEEEKHNLNGLLMNIKIRTGVA